MTAVPVTDDMLLANELAIEQGAPSPLAEFDALFAYARTIGAVDADSRATYERQFAIDRSLGRAAIDQLIVQRLSAEQKGSLTDSIITVARVHADQGYPSPDLGGPADSLVGSMPGFGRGPAGDGRSSVITRAGD